MEKIIAFSGSNSSTSINQELIRLIATQNENITVINLRDFNIPLFGVDLEKEKGIPEDIQKLVATIKKYDRVLISTPEHNGAMPAFFKNVLDWISRYELKFLENKKVIIISTSPGKRGGIGALTALENQLNRYSGAEIIYKQAVSSFQEQKDNNTLASDIKPILEALQN